MMEMVRATEIVAHRITKQKSTEQDLIVSLSENWA